jgi:hypothetical protein
MQIGSVYVAPATAIETPSDNKVQLYFDSATGAFSAKNSSGTSFNPSAGTSGLTVYADNAAAVAGGLSVGDYYAFTGPVGTTLVAVVV